MPEKSKLPDFKEITEIASKIFNDIKKSVKQVFQEFKTKRATSTEPRPTKPKETPVKKETVAKKETPKPKAAAKSTTAKKKTSSSKE